MRKIFYLVALFILGISSVAFCQGTNTVLQNITSKLKTLSTNHVIEKAYLHFDKPYYTTGDTMYFKAYVTVGDRPDISKASEILHVDFINPQNVIIRSIRLQLNKGITWGDFDLPDTLQGGLYKVRAFTHYMQNTPEYFFTKTIAVGGNNKNNSVNASVKADIQFFPEGGEMITSMVSKVAFKAIGTNGMGLSAKGVITDNTNVQVATFASNRLGMGSFYIQPIEGKTYKAKVTFEDGTQSTVDLPAAEAKGITLQVRDTLGKTSLVIVCNKAYFQENQGKDVNLVMYCQGRLSTVNTKLDNRVMGMDIQKNQFSSGTMQITLFSHDGEPLSERLIFLKNDDLLNIAINSNKPVYKIHDKVEVNFNAKSNNTNSAGFFSVAVVDDSRVPFDDNNETTILSYLLLTSDLKGYIEQPNYYFTSNSKQVQTDLDNLMLTQGYRKFSWKQLLNSDIKPFTYASVKDLNIMGNEKTSSGEPVANKDVILMQGGNVIGTAKTNNNGSFLFSMPPFYAGTSFNLQATGSTKDKKSTVITVEKSSEPPVINNASDSLMSLSTIHLSGGGTGTVTANTANSEQTVDGDEISGATSLTLALSGRLHDLNFVSGVPYLKGLKYPVLIVIDGKIRNSYINLDGVAPSNVKAVQLLKGNSASSYGSSGSSGVLIINTRYGITNAALNEQNTYKYEAQNVVKAKYNYTSGTNNSSYRSSNLGGSGHADQVVSGDVIKTMPNLPNGLNGVLRGVQFDGGVPYLRESAMVGAGQLEPMYIMLDGNPISATVFGNLDPRVIETVEVLKGPNAAIYGMNGGAGVIVITSRTQLSEDVQTIGSSLGTLQFKPMGFYKAREFYSPKYDVSSSAAIGPDVRSTLYWNPNIVTDNDGNATFEFYNSDGHGSFRVIVEGIDVNGNIGRQVYRYKVE